MVEAGTGNPEAALAREEEWNGCSFGARNMVINKDVLHLFFGWHTKRLDAVAGLPGAYCEICPCLRPININGVTGGQFQNLPYLLPVFLTKSLFCSGCQIFWKNVCSGLPLCARHMDCAGDGQVRCVAGVRRRLFSLRGSVLKNEPVCRAKNAQLLRQIQPSLLVCRLPVE